MGNYDGLLLDCREARRATVRFLCCALFLIATAFTASAQESRPRSGSDDAQARIIVKNVEDQFFEALDRFGELHHVKYLGKAVKLFYGSSYTLGAKDVLKITRANMQSGEKANEAVREVIADKVRDAVGEMLLEGTKYLLRKAPVGVAIASKLNLATAIVSAMLESTDIADDYLNDPEARRKAEAWLDHARQPDQLRYLDKLLAGKQPNATELPDYLRNTRKGSSAHKGSAHPSWQGYFERADGKKRFEVAVTESDSGKYSTYSGALSFIFEVTKADKDEQNNLRLACRTKPEGVTFTLTGNNEQLTGNAAFISISGKRIEGRVTLSAKKP